MLAHDRQLARRSVASIILAISSSALLAGDPDAQLIEADDSHTVIAFKLSGLRFDTVAAMPGSATPTLAVDFHNGVPAGASGIYSLPVRVFILGIPQGSTADVSAIPLQATELREIDLARMPQPDEKSELQRGSQVREDGPVPGEIAWIETLGQFRQQTVARLVVAPLQYHPKERRLRIVPEMRLTVRYRGAKTSAVAPSEATSTWEEAFYRHVLFNYDQAAAFREPRAAKLAKPPSPHAGGPLYKFSIKDEGIYRITGQTLSANGINLGDVLPGDIRLYNNGGRELPKALNAPRPEGLVENAIYVSDGGDGRLDLNDYILFYGRGPNGYAWDDTGAAYHYLNRYGFDNFYWLTFENMPDSPAKRMQARAPLPVASASTIRSSFREHLYNEEELNVLFESVHTWFGFEFTQQLQGRKEKTYRFSLADPVADATALAKVVLYAPAIKGYSGAIHSVSFAFEGQDLDDLELWGLSSRTQDHTLHLFGNLKNGVNELKVSYTPSGSVVKMYLDYIEFAYDRQLRMNGASLIFDGYATDQPVAYQLANTNPQGLWLFEVSRFDEVELLTSENWLAQESQLTFADLGSTPAPRRYVAASSSAFTDVKNLTLDSPSALRTSSHGAEMVIITHHDFMSQAERLKSLRENWHPLSSTRQMTVEIVDIQDVFDEFSCGMYDPVAIRDFLKYAYENWNPAPTFVVLFGDGDHDPKNIFNKTDKNWIPAYHTAEFDEDVSRVTDSWYTYVQGNDPIMDLAIGRIPARTLTDAKAYIDKLVKYETVPVYGSWRNTMIMVADDELITGGEPSGRDDAHVSDAENLAISLTPKYFDLKKVYLTEFPGVQNASVSGVLKPQATEALLRLVNSGALVINYHGHGNPIQWSHENLLHVSTDLSRIQNGDKQALWVAATCTFGKFDEPDRQSFAELLLLAPERGAIAMLATTRDVYADRNAALNRALYNNLFPKDDESPAVGFAFWRARNDLGTSSVVNDEKFHLYGDPSMRLSIPRYSAVLEAPDTLKALGLARVRGTVTRNGEPWNSFNGKVRLEAFDSQRRVRYRSPAGFTLNYTLPGNSLFRGEAAVTNGNFEVQFLVPKDLSYGGSTGRVNVYFWNDSTDGNGYKEGIAISGASSSLVDREGPEIEIGFAGIENFSTGGYVGLDPTLHATLSDSLSGINLAGEIGHKITLEVDGNTADKIDVTDLFSYDSGSFQKGSLFYRLEGLAEGRHTVELKAWDNFNNSSVASAEFLVAPQDRLALDRVMNYPNPFSNETAFTFGINQPAAKVQIKIYTLSGKLIRTLEHRVASTGLNIVPWDGLDQDGDRLANGVYLYKIIASLAELNGNGSSRAEEIGKLLVQR